MLSHLPDLDDKVVHYLYLAAGLFIASFLKVGFDYIAKKTWRKIDEEASDFKDFKAWQKQKKKAAKA